MAIVDGRPSGRKPSADPKREGLQILANLTGKPSHDYPACAIFRGGKCTCDEADKLCPHCGSEEWDHVTAERGRERDVPFNRCNRCEREWDAARAAVSRALDAPEQPKESK